MADEFVKRDYHIISQGTDSHLMLIDLRNKGVSGKKAERILGEADITVNKNMVPFDDRSPFITSGIRIGTPAATSRGMKEGEMTKIVAFIDRLISDPDNEALPDIVKKEVHAMTQQFPLYN